MNCAYCSTDFPQQEMATGRMCRPCKALLTKRFREKRKAEGRPYYAAVIAGKITQRQRLARRLVEKGLRLGVLVRPLICSRCGNGPGRSGVLDAHHADYLKPLDLQWVCRTCHIKIHKDPSASINADGPADPAIYDLAQVRPNRPWPGTQTGASK